MHVWLAQIELARHGVFGEKGGATAVKLSHLLPLAGLQSARGSTTAAPAVLLYYGAVLSRAAMTRLQRPGHFMWITGRRALWPSGSGTGKNLYDLLPHDLGNIPFPGNTAHGENPQSPLAFWDLFPLFPLFPVPSRGAVWRCLHQG